MSNIISTLTKELSPIIEQNNCELVDISYTNFRGSTTLTIFIDKGGGVTLDDCETVHYAIEPILDELNPTKDIPYTLNVSSPGLDRPFKTMRDYLRNYGKDVEIKLYAPINKTKNLEGRLIERTDTEVIISIDDKIINIPLSSIAKITQAIKFI